MKKGHVQKYDSKKTSDDCDTLSCESMDAIVDENMITWEQLVKKGCDYDRKIPNVSQDDVYVEMFCDVCNHVFFTKAQMSEMDCPYCGHHINLKDYEELHVTIHNDQNADRCAKLEECAISMRRKNMNDVWVNDAKEQLNLAPGTTEYAEYVEDLKEHNPFRPDDTMHESLEDYNEDLVTKLYEKAEEQYDIDDVSMKQKNHVEGLKRSIHNNVIKSVAAVAAATPSKKDDMRVKQLNVDNSILHDDGVSLDDYKDAISDYVFDK